MVKRLIGLIGVLCLAQASWAVEPVISIIYRDKPPYTYSKDGRPAGFLLERTVDILRRAGVVAEYVKVPVKRIMKDIQDNKQLICSPGWYKIPEREVFARFSLPIHQDKPHIVLANVQAMNQIRMMTTLKELLANPNIKLGKVSGTSYGEDLDAMMSNAATTVMDSTVTPGGLANMIAMRRADYMLIDVEDYNFLVENKEIDQEKVVILKFKDIPSGLKRYIMCSKSVSPEVMRRIDQSIQIVVPGL